MAETVLQSSQALMYGNWLVIIHTQTFTADMCILAIGNELNLNIHTNTCAGSTSKQQTPPQSKMSELTFADNSFASSIAFFASLKKAATALWGALPAA